MARPALDRRPRSSTARAIFFRVFFSPRNARSAQAAERKAQGYEERVAPTLPQRTAKVANAKSVTGKRFC